MATKSEVAKRREANRAQYAPKPKAVPATNRPASIVDIRLRKIVVRMLDELKQAGAVPSEVLMRGLEEAAGK